MSKQPESHAIVVGVRVRPFNQREIKYGSKCIVGMEANTIKMSEVSGGKVLLGKPREFIFDFAFWTHDKDSSGNTCTVANPSFQQPYADQRYVYDRLGLQIVNNVFEGFNSCLFAYGQTGSGKTYSMMGTASDAGMLPRIGTDVFARAAELIGRKNECTVTASFCELYNEKCRDLLSEHEAGNKFYEAGSAATSLKIRQHPQHGVFVENLTKYDLTTQEEFVRLLEKGLGNRATASTNMNMTSSRSHAIVLLKVHQKDFSGSKTGKMSLVDLAGSERLESTGATGATALEGQNINLSLTTLGMVLGRLAEKASGKSGLHIPYRDSQLTFLLSDNLGGNSKTSMLAAISPASVNYDETLSTLRFSSVAKKVKTNAVVNEDPNDKIIRELKDELSQLKDKLQRLQMQRRNSKATANPMLKHGSPSCPDAPPAPPGAGAGVVSTPPSSGVSTATPQSPSATSPSTPTASAAARLEEVKSVLEQIAEDEGVLKDLEKTHRMGSALLLKDSTLSDDVDLNSTARSTAGGSVLRRGGSLAPTFFNVHRPTTAPAHRDANDADETPPLEGIVAVPSTAPAEPLENSDLLMSLTMGRRNVGFQLDDSLVDQKTHTVTLDDTFTLSGTNNNIPRDDRGVSPDADSTSQVSNSAAREVAVDWRAPQLVNLRPDEAGDSLVIALFEGENEFEIDGFEVIINYDALLSQATIYSTSSGAVFLNGVEIEDEGTLLRHNDRIVVGESAFRFAHSARDACDFKTEPINLEHLDLLQRYRRAQILEERSKNAMSIGKAYFHGLSSLSEGSVKAPELLLSARGEQSTTPRSSNPLLAHIGDDVAMTNQQVFRLEMQLADEYPIDMDDERDDFVVDDTEYQEALNEKEKHVTEQHLELENLKELLTREQRSDSASPSPRRMPGAERVIQEDINATCSEVILATELAWHRRVKLIKGFRPNTAPQDAVDAALWRRLDSDPPFFSDPMLKVERTELMQVSDRRAHHGRWQPMYVSASRRFLFLFKSGSQLTPCVTAVYLLGSTLTLIGGDRGSRRVDPSDEETLRADGPKYTIEVSPAVARSAADGALASHECTIIFGSDDWTAMTSWKHFLEECAVPTMPLSMLKRFTKERIATSGTMDVTVVSPARTDSDMMPNKLKWKPDNAVKACENCKRDFITILRKRHHCRDCGGIFCSDCLDKQKKCDKCRDTVRKVEKIFATTEIRRRANILSEFELKHAEYLRCSYKVGLDIVPNGKREEALVASIQQLRQLDTDRPANGEGHSRFTMGRESDGRIKFFVDHYKGRAHTIVGDEIENVERSQIDPQRLAMRLRDGTTMNLNFSSAFQRERCFESLVVLMGHRVYLGGIRDIVELSDLIITNDVGEDAFFRATSRMCTDGKFWFGIEDGRTIPFHENYAFWVFLGYQETWDDATLQRYRLEMVSNSHISNGLNLYVVATGEWRHNVISATACAVSSKGHATVAVAVRVLETALLFLGVDAVTEDGFVDVGDHKMIESISTMSLPAVDALQQFDHVFALNPPQRLPCFEVVCPTVHMRSDTAVVLRTGRTSAEVLVPCINFCFSKCSETPEGRLKLHVLSATFPSVLQVRGGIVASRLPKGELVAETQLWCSAAFDRVIGDELFTDQRNASQRAASASEASQPAENPFAAIVLANSLPEYQVLGNIFAVVSDVGTAVIPIAQCAHGVSTLQTEVRSGGHLIGIAEVKISAEWVTTFDE